MNKSDKKELRRSIIGKRMKLSGAEIEQKSRSIAERFGNLECYRSAQVIMFFIPFRNEVDTRYMIDLSLAGKKKVLVPYTVKEDRTLIPSHLLNWEEDLAEGTYGIMEPLPERIRAVEPEQIDMVIVPGVAFDLNGNRLGYGGGYYDRFFERLREDTYLVAVAFELQVVEKVPTEKWDRPIDGLVTENRTVWFGS